MGRQPDSADRYARVWKVFIEVIEPASGQVMYSRGFASIYGEWETTPEFRAKPEHSTSRAVPRPVALVRVVVKTARSANEFRQLWQRDVDPRAAVPDEFARRGVRTTFDVVRKRPAEPRGGPPIHRRTVLARLKRGNFTLTPRGSSMRCSRSSLSNPPRRFQRRALQVPGIDLDGEFNIFGLDRYALTYDNRSLRNRPRPRVPIVEIVINESDTAAAAFTTSSRRSRRQ